MLELRRGKFRQVQKEMVEYIAFLFPFSREQTIWSFHIIVVQGQQRNLQKSMMHVQSC